MKRGNVVRLWVPSRNLNVAVPLHRFNPVVVDLDDDDHAALSNKYELTYSDLPKDARSDPCGCWLLANPASPGMFPTLQDPTAFPLTEVPMPIDGSFVFNIDAEVLWQYEMETSSEPRGVVHIKDMLSDTEEDIIVWREYAKDGFFKDGQRYLLLQVEGRTKRTSGNRTYDSKLQLCLWWYEAAIEL